MRYRVSKAARQDLDAIFIYWAKRASVEVADRLIEGIMEHFWLLGEHPDAGRPSDEIAPGVKSFPAGKYLIYYRRMRLGTEILHVFHGAQDQKRAFRKAGRKRMLSPKR